MTMFLTNLETHYQITNDDSKTNIGKRMSKMMKINVRDPSKFVFFLRFMLKNLKRREKQ